MKKNSFKNRAFRERKRREARKALAALDVLIFAGMFTPACNDILAASTHLKNAIDLMSIKSWGR